MCAVTQTDGLVQVHLVVIQVIFRGGSSMLAKNGRGGFLPVRGKRLLRSRRRRQREHAVVETVIPEVVKGRVATLSGIEGIPPGTTEVFVEIRRTSEPFQQALLRRARVEQRRDRGLRKAVEGRDRLGISPRFEEVVIRTDRVSP